MSSSMATQTRLRSPPLMPFCSGLPMMVFLQGDGSNGSNGSGWGWQLPGEGFAIAPDGRKGHPPHLMPGALTFALPFNPTRLSDLPQHLLGVQQAHLLQHALHLGIVPVTQTAAQGHAHPQLPYPRPAPKACSLGVQQPHLLQHAFHLGVALLAGLARRQAQLSGEVQRLLHGLQTKVAEKVKSRGPGKSNEGGPESQTKEVGKVKRRRSGKSGMHEGACVRPDGPRWPTTWQHITSPTPSHTYYTYPHCAPTSAVLRTSSCMT